MRLQHVIDDGIEPVSFLLQNYTFWNCFRQSHSLIWVKIDRATHPFRDGNLTLSVEYLLVFSGVN